eukprot:UN23562
MPLLLYETQMLDETSMVIVTSSLVYCFYSTNDNRIMNENINKQNHNNNLHIFMTAWVIFLSIGFNFSTRDKLGVDSTIHFIFRVLSTLTFTVGFCIV